MNNESANQILEAVRIVLERNLDNQLTQELANGMFTTISNSARSLIPPAPQPVPAAEPAKPSHNSAHE